MLEAGAPTEIACWTKPRVSPRMEIVRRVVRPFVEMILGIHENPEGALALRPGVWTQRVGKTNNESRSKL